jgi:hypothetical protein
MKREAVLLNIIFQIICDILYISKRKRKKKKVIKLDLHYFVYSDVCEYVDVFVG